MGVRWYAVRGDRVLDLGPLLLYARRIVFLNRRFGHVFRARSRLFVSRVGANLTTFRFRFDYYVLLLYVRHVRPRYFGLNMGPFLLILRIRR